MEFLIQKISACCSSQQLNLFETSFISQHFPSSLSQNVSKIEWLIYHEEHSKATEKLKLLVEVAKKFEDYGLLILLFEITQQNKLLSTTLGKQLNLESNKEYLMLFSDLKNLLQKQDELTSTTLIEEQKVVHP